MFLASSVWMIFFLIGKYCKFSINSVFSSEYMYNASRGIHLNNIETKISRK